MPHGEYALFAGLDVSMDRTGLCFVDARGDVIWRGACATDPGSLAATIHRAGGGRRTRAGLDARHLRAALSSRPNKSDETGSLAAA